MRINSFNSFNYIMIKLIGVFFYNLALLFDVGLIYNYRNLENMCMLYYLHCSVVYNVSWWNFEVESFARSVC